MSVNDIKPLNTVTAGTISQENMNLRILSFIHTASYLLIIIALIVSIIYMIKSRKKIINKIIIGVVIILVPIIINIVLGLVKTNMLLNTEKTFNQSNTTATNNVKNNTLVLWINNYKKLQVRKSTYNLNLFGNKQTTGITTPIDINKLNEYTATYVYYPYNSTQKVKTSSLNDINNIAVSTVYVRDKDNSLLFIIDLNGEGLTFKECIEQGKFIIRAQGDLFKGSMNISASQLGLNIQNENFDDQSNILDAITNNWGAPTYIISDKSLEEVQKESIPSIQYKLIYQYSKYVVELYVQEYMKGDTKNCEIKYIVYCPIERFDNYILTDNNDYSVRIK